MNCKQEEQLQGRIVDPNPNGFQKVKRRKKENSGFERQPKYKNPKEVARLRTFSNAKGQE